MPDFQFYQNDREESLISMNLAGIPALKTVPRLDLGIEHWGDTPPAHILRYFSETPYLVLNERHQSILQDIPKDDRLFPGLTTLELVNFDCQSWRTRGVISDTLRIVRKARPSLAKLVLHKSQVHYRKPRLLFACICYAHIRGKFTHLWEEGELELANSGNPRLELTSFQQPPTPKGHRARSHCPCMDKRLKGVSVW